MLNESYDGKLLFREIALYAGAQQLNVIIVSMMVTLMKFAVPFLARVYQDIKLEGVDSIAFIVIEIMASMMVVVPNYMFVLAGLLDFHRRYLMMKQCGALLHPSKEVLPLKF